MTLERIRGVVGSNDEEGIACVGSPGLLDTYKPGSFTVHPFSSMDNTADSSLAARVVAFRVFRPALETFGETQSAETVLRSALAPASSGTRGIGSVVHLGQLVERFHLGARGVGCRPEDAAGIGFYRIYRDRLRRQWFVEGVFD